MDISFKHSLKLAGLCSPLKKIRPKPKRNGLSRLSKHQFSGAKMLVSRRVTSPPWSWTPPSPALHVPSEASKKTTLPRHLRRGVRCHQHLPIPVVQCLGWLDSHICWNLWPMLEKITCQATNSIIEDMFMKLSNRIKISKKNQCRNQKFQMVNDWWENHGLPKWIVWAKTYCRRSPCTRKANFMHIGMKWSSCQTLGQSFFKIFIWQHV